MEGRDQWGMIPPALGQGGGVEEPCGVTFRVFNPGWPSYWFVCCCPTISSAPFVPRSSTAGSLLLCQATQ